MTWLMEQLRTIKKIQNRWQQNIRKSKTPQKTKFWNFLFLQTKHLKMVYLPVGGL